ncbi:putative BTB/POZ domain, NPH3 domain, NPH3/RPT2-like family protein [Helianthus annuus]|uniref:BTB/POZ domain, NPH3 domain-containing protein n=1 Tax=Helianthus annuus TaxID=4232 RepID=A0A251SH13_HELAN|nr:BTB/POZ domain-containing protein SR1IP1 [Helianthus annuus]XP_022009525.1 BTB/POZ domain-containing protein SR1IP1 [Helianthus annuus]XP_022009526.1 BTB/POZ domain-containing protein SR1IP1 [Helianthus annuus]KAF5798854.1 putative BTB/POZ domain, NPH3 domain-containing protein [Helianthus annuus]KAJ0550400.1 putative BTB/POZ domain, NPH3 domain, NPH3/RPT2-like family protein [Helianthus annuus]KAJ0557108.1 putative BTB/POZ domain, NPH3 domain, NPH3/RPT2-like family protein [Helianthus annu
MVDVYQEGGELPMTLHMPATKKELTSDAMKRISEWISSQDVPSDVIVSVGGVSFPTHKFALISKCGYIKKLLSDTKDADLSVVEIPDIPGGPEGFELAAKFCYETHLELSLDNIAMARCVAEYLEMTEEYAVGNLVSITEGYLNKTGLQNLSGAASILQSSANLLPVSEKVKLIDRCVDTIACMVTDESQVYVVDWWAEDLIGLRIDMFKRVLLALVSRGFKQFALGPVLMLYAQKCLRGLDFYSKSRKNLDPKQEHEKRIILETIVGLLPREKNAMSISFLSMLLRAAKHLDTTVACRLDLEKRMGLQLGQAVLEDILIPSFCFDGDTLFDVDTVQQIMMNYFEYMSKDSGDMNHAYPSQSDNENVGMLMESFLAKIASDRNLLVSKFINFAECIPMEVRVTEDGMYRAIDIYLKAHPAISDMDRKKVCSLMDCQKLSREARAHAAQNERLPVQTMVQVLYYEQQRLREMDSSSPITDLVTSHTTLESQKSVSDEISRLKKENQELKFELIKMKTRLKEIEKSNVNKPKGNNANESGGSKGKPPLPKRSLISSVTKKLGKITPFLHADGFLPSSTRGRNKPDKDRRHSVA